MFALILVTNHAKVNHADSITGICNDASARVFSLSELNSALANNILFMSNHKLLANAIVCDRIQTIMLLLGIGHREGLNLNPFSFQDLPHKSIRDYHKCPFLSPGLLSPLFPVPALAPKDAIRQRQRFRQI